MARTRVDDVEILHRGIGRRQCLGCLLRWCLAVFLNRYFPTIPPGTLAANLIGCYIIGMAIAFFTTYPTFAPELAPVRDDGVFCGGVDHVSRPFPRKVVILMQSGPAPFGPWARVAAHLVGSLLMTFAGIFTVLWLKG